MHMQCPSSLCVPAQLPFRVVRRFASIRASRTLVELSPASRSVRTGGRPPKAATSLTSGSVCARVPGTRTARRVVASFSVGCGRSGVRFGVFAGTGNSASAAAPRWLPSSAVSSTCFLCSTWLALAGGRTKFVVQWSGGQSALRSIPDCQLGGELGDWCDRGQRPLLRGGFIQRSPIPSL